MGQRGELRVGHYKQIGICCRPVCFKSVRGLRGVRERGGKGVKIFTKSADLKNGTSFTCLNSEGLEGMTQRVEKQRSAKPASNTQGKC